MKRFVVFGVMASLLLAGCGTVASEQSPGQTMTSPAGLKPPKVSVEIAGQPIKTVMNGYEWSSGGRGSVADAASDPAKNLTKYNAAVRSKVTVTFSKKPGQVQVAMWLGEKRISTTPLRGPSFSLPAQPGDYTYEVTGHWGSNYVNYDFEVHLVPVHTTATTKPANTANDDNKSG